MLGTYKKIHEKKEKKDYWNSTSLSRLMPSLKPHDQTAYWHYRRHRKTKHEIGENRSLFSKTVSSIFKAIGELTCEYEGGVFLEDYGLFTAMVIPWKDRGNTFKNAKDLYFHTEGRCYTLQFFSETTSGSSLSKMVMDRTFEKDVRTRLSKNLFDGFRPKLYYTTLKSIHGRSRK